MMTYDTLDKAVEFRMITEKDRPNWQKWLGGDPLLAPDKLVAVLWSGGHMSCGKVENMGFHNAPTDGSVYVWWGYHKYQIARMARRRRKEAHNA